MSLPHRTQAAPNRVLPAAVLAWALLLAACAPTGGPQPPPEALPESIRLEPPLHEQVSLVYGYLDMSEAPTPLGWMEFRQVAPRTERPFYQMRVYEGVFYMEKFTPGVYVMGEFGGERRDGQHLTYALPRSGPAVRLSIGTPGLYFVGAYKYRPVTENGVRVGRFEIDKRGAPSEAEVLARILPFARGTDWEQRIQERLGAAQAGRPVRRTSG